MVLYLAALADCLPARKGLRTLSMRERYSGFLIRMFGGEFYRNCPKAVDFRCPRKDVTFWLSTTTSQNRRKLNPLNPTGKFVRGAPLKILIDGYLMNLENSFLNQDFRLAYFSRGEYNVISVDWSPLCKKKCYVSAALSVPTVGQCLAQLISNLEEVQAGVFSDIHVIGTSLGAHIAAWASALHFQPLPRVTLLDPALPMFNDKVSLFTRAKGEVVDVWHTNNRVFGRSDPDGTVDIYINNGMDQPGCSCDVMCSHGRGMRIYAETISSSEPFLAFPCPGRWSAYQRGLCKIPKGEDLAHFGEDFSLGTTGIYLAFTNTFSPYIIPTDFYLNELTFYSFKKRNDVKCLRSRLVTIFSKRIF